MGFHERNQGLVCPRCLNEDLIYRVIYIDAMISGLVDSYEWYCKKCDMAFFTRQSLDELFGLNGA